jgi:hypothetical protein
MSPRGLIVLVISYFFVYPGEQLFQIVESDVTHVGDSDEHRRPPKTGQTESDRMQLPHDLVIKADILGNVQRAVRADIAGDCHVRDPDFSGMNRTV